jgi:hypothetical protein
MVTPSSRAADYSMTYAMRVRKKTKLNASQTRAISVAASCDPRTLRRYVTGERVQPLCQERIERALREAGLEAFVR